MKRKLEKLTESSDDTAEQEKDLEVEITRLESETLEERNQRKEEDDRKKEEARQQKEVENDRMKEMKEAACKHVGCDNDVWARGVCHKHVAAEKRAKIVT